MDRREFVRNALTGITFGAGWKESAARGSTGGPRLQEERDEKATRTTASQGQRLFPSSVPAGEWAQFEAAGYSEPACGVVYRKQSEVLNGMPLGGIGTGYLDVGTDGRWGYCTLFNSGVPVRGPLELPFLGVCIDRQPLVLTTQEVLGAANARDIHYWGHYPIVDLEYETAAPVSIGARIWSPFVPGDLRASNTPAAVFEIHLRNTSAQKREISLVFSFPGPTQAEAQISPTSQRQHQYIMGYPVSEPVSQGVIPARRKEISAGAFRGIFVASDPGASYALGIIDSEKLRFGGPLGRYGYDFTSGHEWAAIPWGMPRLAETDFATSMAVDFDLGPGETKTIHILLAWHSPIWKGEGANCFHRMYAKQFQDAVAVAEAVANDHASLLQRVLAWQQAVYTSQELPVWLRESLVNILHLITKTSYWAQAKPPIGDWCRAEDGLFGLNESPRECPQIECIPCSFYGNIPIVYFFPELALSTLRGYKAYQYPDGAAPWIFGGITAGALEGSQSTDGADLATPSPGLQTTLNGPCFVDMVDRYWLRSGNDAVLEELYPAVKKNTIYTMGLRSGPDGIVSVPEGNRNPTPVKLKPGAGLEWFEGNGWFGMTPHVGGIHLAQLRMAERMTEKVGDKGFAQQCRQWLEQGSKSMETKLWNGKYYLAYYEPESGKKSDLVFGYQLDGDWMCFYHGLPGVFEAKRARTTLETIKNTCMAIAPYGAANFANADGTVSDTSKSKAEGWGLDYGAYSYFTPEAWMLAGTYLYQGYDELGMKLAENCARAMMEHGYTWT
ncbi:MAG: hypothetical protein LAP13_02940, partial [Acidobacteriia bacterium]|nr:hypothetical protein [Terriglobia bacterium]